MDRREEDERNKNGSIKGQLFPSWPFDEDGADELRQRIEGRFKDLEQLFERVATSGKRLKTLPKLPLPTLAIPYELAAIQSLRALHLTTGAAHLLDEANWAAAFPVLRALFELWISVEYAERSFRHLVVNKSRWGRYDEIATRLLRGRTAAGLDPDESPPEEAAIIPIGQMLDLVANEIASDSEAVAKAIRHHYAVLSDYTHPTIWSLVQSLEERPDGLGTIIHRDPQLRGVLGPLSDLDLLLGLTVDGLTRFEKTADEMEDAFRRGPGTDPVAQAATRAFLESLAAANPSLPEREAELFAERLESLLEHFQTQANQGHDHD
jgi:hypothetical protein